jgi:glyceraldehyde-3-phosphate dehydrogenase/erythrose-4-phosphate dehydrogenase
MAFRVPTPDVSVVDLTVRLAKVYKKTLSELNYELNDLQRLTIQLKGSGWVNPWNR